MNRYALIEELSAAIVYNRDLGRGDQAKILEHASTRASLHMTQHLIELQRLEQVTSALVKSMSARTELRRWTTRSWLNWRTRLLLLVLRLAMRSMMLHVCLNSLADPALR